MPTNLTVQCINLLRATHNLILHGAPGTGKTHLAKEIVKALEAEAEFVQFHPSYDYTDFVEGLRPVKHIRENEIGFERRDGVFKAFCKKALDAREVEEKRFNTLQSTQSHDGQNTSQNLADVDRSIDEAINRFKSEADNMQLPCIRNTFNIFTVKISNDKIRVINSQDNEYATSPKKIITYLKTGEYDPSHDTYEPSIGKYILDNYFSGTPLCKNLTNPSTQTNTTTSVSVVTTNKNIRQPYIIIIDEINRGEISKIFGELFFAIESGYRGDKHKINTQYQNLVSDDDIFRDGFFVPENVYIIGTMNDIDRSVEPIDFAFRRRFSWKEIKAEDTQDDILQMLDSGLQIEAKQRMDKLNSAILQTEGLSSAYQIGAAYFLKLSDLHGDFEKLWEYHLRDLLVEYLRGHSEAETKLKRLENAYKLQQTNFADDVDDE